MINKSRKVQKKEGKVLDKDLFITPDRPTAIRQAFKMAKKALKEMGF